MDISSLDEKVSFENPVFTNDDGGGQDDDADDYVSFLSDVWARVEKKTGYTNFNEGFEAAVTRYDIWVRYRSEIETNIKKSTRIVYKNKRCKIEGEPELIDEKKRFYHFTVTAVN